MTTTTSQPCLILKFTDSTANETHLIVLNLISCLFGGSYPVRTNAAASYGPAGDFTKDAATKRCSRAARAPIPEDRVSDPDGRRGRLPNPASKYAMNVPRIIQEITSHCPNCNHQKQAEERIIALTNSDQTVSSTLAHIRFTVAPAVSVGGGFSDLGKR